MQWCSIAVERNGHRRGEKYGSYLGMRVRIYSGIEAGKGANVVQLFGEAEQGKVLLLLLFSKRELRHAQKLVDQ